MGILLEDKTGNIYCGHFLNDNRDGDLFIIKGNNIDGRPKKQEWENDRMVRDIPIDK